MTNLEMILGGLLLLSVAVATWGFLAHRGANDRATRLEAALLAAEKVAADKGDAAARLPDALARAADAESRAEGLAGRLSEAASTISALQATASHDAQERKRLMQEADTLRSAQFAAQDACTKAESSVVSLDARLRAALQARDEDQARIAADKAQIEALNTELRDTSTALTQADANCAAAKLLQEQTAAFLAEAQSQLKTAFTEAASKVFDEKSIVLDQRIKDTGETSRVGLEATLKPLNEALAAFQGKLETMAQDHTRDTAALGGQISTLQTLNQNMADSANQLSRALKGSAKIRGDWGEMILDTVLRASGLVEKSNYIRQDSNVNEEGRRQQPDVVILLPGDRKVVVDSKVSLVAWMDVVNADTPDLANDALIRHVASMRQHMRDLCDRNYPSLYEGNALEYTVCFVPIEGALSQALGLVPELQTEAFNKRIVLATPNTLMALLSVVERLWTKDKLQKQVEVIGQTAGHLLDSVITLMDNFGEVERKLEQTQSAVKAARNSLSDSPRSVEARARRLVDAGAKGKKSLPEALKSDNEPLPLALSLVPEP